MTEPHLCVVIYQRHQGGAELEDRHHQHHTNDPENIVSGVTGAVEAQGDNLVAAILATVMTEVGVVALLAGKGDTSEPGLCVRISV